jgi:hypothetical protein
LPGFVSFDFLLSASIVPILASVRLHAARHSALVIWVPRSQKFMQSASVFPPPPGALAAASLALALPVGARLVRPGTVAEGERLAGVAPLDNGVVVIWGDMEGSGASDGIGEPIADEGAGLRAPVAGLAGVTGVCVAPRDGFCAVVGELTCAVASTMPMTMVANIRVMRMSVSCGAEYENGARGR